MFQIIRPVIQYDGKLIDPETGEEIEIGKQNTGGRAFLSFEDFLRAAQQDWLPAHAWTRIDPSFFEPAADGSVPCPEYTVTQLIEFVFVLEIYDHRLANQVVTEVYEKTGLNLLVRARAVASVEVEQDGEEEDQTIGAHGRLN